MDPHFANNIAKGRLKNNLELAEQLRLERRINPKGKGQLLSRLYALVRKLIDYRTAKTSPFKQ